MVKAKSPKEKIKEIKQTVIISGKLLSLVWKIDSRLFLAAFISKILPAVIPFVNIYIYKLIIDLVVQSINSHVEVLNSLYFLIALRILTYFVQDVSFRTQELVERLYWTKVPIYLNQIFLKKLTSLDIQYFEDSRFRNLMEQAKE